jgi:DNA-binding MarR family transcriptional regulator
VDQASQRELKILTEIAGRDNLTQRDLSKTLGIALGLTNLYVRRLARKGYVKFSAMPPKRLKYLITPQGIAEKSRLTYEYMTLSMALYRQTRAALGEVLRPLVNDGVTRFALLGVGEAAELAYLTLRELGVDVVGVYGASAGGTFLGFPVLPCERVAEARCDRVIVASFGPVSESELAELLRLVPQEKLIVLGRDASF